MSLYKAAILVVGLPRAAKRAVVFAVDASFCLLTVWLAFYLRLGEFISLGRSDPWSSGVLHATLISIALSLPIFIAFGLYNAIFRYSGWPAFSTIGKATSAYALLYFAIISVVGLIDVPRTIGIIQPILLLLFVGASRALANIWLGGEYQRILRNTCRKKVLIYGAGQTGRQLAAAMSNGHEMQVAGFLDDDKRLHGHVLNGLRIYRPIDLPHLAKTLNIGDVLLAMPSIGRQRRNQILTQIQAAHVSVRTVPSVTHLAQGLVSVNDLRELDIDDLLGREAVAPNITLLTKSIFDKVVLVTGAGGSIGSELCRQIMSIKPAWVLLVEQSESALYAVHQELEARFRDHRNRIIPLLASVQDRGRMYEVMSAWQPDTVYHAAAYKHVPLVEHNPAEGLKNNVIGTLRTAQVALETGVSEFILVSTDKAVRPTNIMGASKRVAEMVLQGLAESNPKTRFAMVRFGNVLGSSGSVVPKFRRQIRDGGPITLTHPDVTRYFMSIPEAAQLVIQAGAMANGGDVFVLDMGDPVRIADLARRMVELSGLTVKEPGYSDGDIEIQITGLRPGEKLFEELLIGEDPEPTSHPRIKRAREDFIPWSQLEPKLASLEYALEVNDINVIRSMVFELVAEYSPSLDIMKWVFAEQESSNS